MKLIAIAIVAAATISCATAHNPIPEQAEPSYRLVLESSDIDDRRVGAPTAKTEATLVVFFASW